jgi:demethylspheroidene O-methyltransferase
MTHASLTDSTSITWRDRWLALRDRCLSSPVFQRRASAFLLTRPTARRHARELFDLVAGFVYSQVLLACVQLRLFDVLAEGPQSLEVLTRRLDLPEEAARRLLAAAVSLRLVEHRSGGRYGLGELGAPMVGNGAVAAMVEHHAALYADLADPVALLRADSGRGALAGYWPYADAQTPGRLTGEHVATYSTLMAASQPLVADEILDAYDLKKHRCLLDVGGGDGSFLAAAAARASSLQLMLFDLPAVAERARARFQRAGLAQRASVFGGSFLSDALPPGADVASLVRVVHDHDDASAMTILRALRQALPAPGRLLLAEPMAGTPGAEAMGDAYFGFYLLAMGKGRPRSAAELIAMLGAAGFATARLVPTRMPLQTQLIVAH